MIKQRYIHPKTISEELAPGTDILVSSTDSGAATIEDFTEISDYTW